MHPCHHPYPFEGFHHCTMERRKEKKKKKQRFKTFILGTDFQTLRQWRFPVLVLSSFHPLFFFAFQSAFLTFSLLSLSPPPNAYFTAQKPRCFDNTQANKTKKKSTHLPSLSLSLSSIHTSKARLLTRSTHPLSPFNKKIKLNVSQGETHRSGFVFLPHGEKLCPFGWVCFRQFG